MRFRAVFERASRLGSGRFKQEVFGQALLEPSDVMIGGEMFRGDSYAFALIDVDTGRPCFYDQSIFALFDIDEEIGDWRQLSQREKASSA